MKYSILIQFNSFINSSYGLASLNLTTIRESDRGWYNCKVYFLNRSPPPSNNKNVTGSWYHLDVHAPPRFVHTSDGKLVLITYFLA